MSIRLSYDKASFEELIKASFGFLESRHGMHFGRVRASGGSDPRDAALVARYTGSDFRFDIGWSQFELSLAVLIKLDDADLSRQESYVYFEPFIEYVTNGQETAIVPYVAENMGVRQIEAVVQARSVVFENGLAPVVVQVSKKIQHHLGNLREVSSEQIRGYHHWMKGSRGSSAGRDELR